ncbi:class I SAM-dependent methyltransferase [Anaeromusa acidaminophila]|uniref:class I SAM-dependent methyltransferase n=1 Tax=Anaeromusa acidaminophila TaxID=81464 RepID=UPI00037C1115|nr:class I SAM-dependent methyltransferase [Anaeromusa acidaminophila]
MKEKKCRFCGSKLQQTFVDLGMSPLSNAYIKQEELVNGETFYPLKTYVCSECFLVQLEEFASPEAIFSDYAYFSSYSESWLAHAKEYTQMMQRRFSLKRESQIVEIASNDGYLLQYFKNDGFSVLGIEPAQNVAKEAIAKGIDSHVGFFGRALARKLKAKGKQADVLLGNNVLAHVPDINDFVAGMEILLADDGVITMEFPHLLQLIKQRQFDTIYHEHFSYLSFYTVEKVFAAHGLKIFDVEELQTHGGSLRIFATKKNSLSHEINARVSLMKVQEQKAGIDLLGTYKNFGEEVCASKRELLHLLISLKSQGKCIVGYGAPAKGNTLLNYCGVRTDFLEYTVDRNPYKQGRFLPGTRIPVFSPDKIKATKPDYVLILPWNLKEEIVKQMEGIRSWGGKFIVPIPHVEVI